MTFEDLLQLRQAVPDDDALPASATQSDLNAVRQRRQLLDRRMQQATSAMETLAQLGDDAADREWRTYLTTRRQTLVDELFTIKSPTRDPKEMARRVNLQLSISCIDRGPSVLTDSGYDLTTLKLGQLMIADGYTVDGADPERHFVGTLPWRGSMKEVDKRIAEHAKRRAQAQAALEALLDDDERTKREADAKAHLDALNSMRLKCDPSRAVYVVPMRADGSVIPLTELTETQRRALARFNAEEQARERERERERAIV